MNSAWAVKWADLLAKAAATFAKAPADVGKSMQDYSWWSEVAGDGRLPASDEVYHYHPITLIAHLALEKS